MELVIRQATVSDLDGLVPLSLMVIGSSTVRPASLIEFESSFCLDRFEHNQSVIFIAVKDGTAVGFTQLYPSFSSGALARIFILNELFVDPGARTLGAGSALLQAAAEYGRRVGALRLVLSTEVTNTADRALYEKLGWKKNTDFCTYQITL